MIETLETVEIEPAADLADCPFCGSKPYWLGVVVRGSSGRVDPHFYHPGDTDCILSGQGYTLASVAAWNARTPSSCKEILQVAEDEVVEVVAEPYEHLHVIIGTWQCGICGATNERAADLLADSGADRAGDAKG